MHIWWLHFDIIKIHKKMWGQSNVERGEAESQGRDFSGMNEISSYQWEGAPSLGKAAYLTNVGAAADSTGAACDKPQLHSHL